MVLVTRSTGTVVTTIAIDTGTIWIIAFFGFACCCTLAFFYCFHKDKFLLLLTEQRYAGSDSAVL